MDRRAAGHELRQINRRPASRRHRRSMSFERYGKGLPQRTAALRLPRTRPFCGARQALATSRLQRRSA